jgi:hypothetical protein
MAGRDGNAVWVVDDSIRVRSFTGKRTVLNARVVQPASKVMDELAAFRHAIHCNAPRRVVAFVAVVAAVHAASIELWVKILEEVINPTGGGIGNEGEVLALSLLLQDVRHRELVACREASAYFLLMLALSDVKLAGNEVDRWAGVEVGVEIVEVRNEVAVARNGNTLVETKFDFR